MNINEVLQDYIDAEQRKAAELAELNTHFAAAIALLQQLVDQVVEEKKGCGW